MQPPLSRVALLPGKFLQIQKVFATSSPLAEFFQIIWKISGCYTKYPDNMQSVRMDLKVFGRCKKCPDNLENVSGKSKKSLDDLEMYIYKPAPEKTCCFHGYNLFFCKIQFRFCRYSLSHTFGVAFHSDIFKVQKHKKALRLWYSFYNEHVILSFEALTTESVLADYD